MESTMLNLIDEALGIKEQEKETWKIKNDLDADWALDKIREIDADYRRMKLVINDKIAQLQERLRIEKEKRDRERSFFESKLREYFEEIDDKNIKKTKTLLKYELPSGKLKLKFKSPELKRNDEKLVEYLENMHPELVKIKKSPDWSSFKKKVQIAEGKAIDTDTGEVIDCIDIVEIEPEFVVEV